MPKILFCICIILISVNLFGQKKAIPKINTGEWVGKLHLNSTTPLPFNLEVSKVKKKYTFTIKNGEERIVLDTILFKKDSLHISFPSFNSYLVLKVANKNTLKGYWLNLNKGINYKIPCVLTAGNTKRFDNPKLYVSTIFPTKLEAKWECVFEPGTEDAYKAVGLFNQSFNEVTGTFLTETGDYRFLQGNVAGDSLFLSCFDGSHAFLFTGKIVHDSILGRFYSGKHWETTWVGTPNNSFELQNPDSLTYIINDAPVSFKLNDLTGKEFSFPNEHFNQKVTIIQIMGTWCPNCMDETKYFKELYSKYHNQGLEIISIGYEVGSSFEDFASKIKTLQNRLDLDFTFLVGGAANKDLASKQFSMLNQIISFPTAIIIGRDGLVKRVTTGFNGPGTGSYYLDYIKETDAFIKALLTVN